jgi:hypothetical protein
MMYARCQDCGFQFRKRSNASTQSRCPECINEGYGPRRNAHASAERLLSREKDEMLKTIAGLEKKIEAMNDSIEGIIRMAIESKIDKFLAKEVPKAVKAQVKKGVEAALVNKTMETVAASHTRSLLNSSKIDEMKRQLKGHKSRITRLYTNQEKLK